MTHLTSEMLSQDTFKALTEAGIHTVECLINLSLAEMCGLKAIRQDNVHEIMEMLVFHFNLPSKNDVIWCRYFAADTVNKYMKMYLKELGLYNGSKFCLIPLKALIETNMDAWAFAYLSCVKVPCAMRFESYEDIVEYRDTCNAEALNC